MTNVPTKITVREALSFAKAPATVEWIPECIMTDLNIYSSFCDIPDEQKARFTETRLIDYYFGSDEVAEATLYYFDGVPFLLAEKYGDRTDYMIKIIDRAAYLKFGLFIFEFSLDANAHVQVVDGLDIELKNENGYLIYEKDPERGGLAVHITSPKWCMGFPHMFDSHDAMFRGQPVTFVGWKNEKRAAWDSGSEIVRLKLPNGDVIECDGGLISFGLRKPSELISA